MSNYYCSHRFDRFAASFVFLGILGVSGCTGGPTSSSSGSSGGSSGTSGASSGTSGSSGSTECTEFKVGAPVDAAIGGSLSNQVTAQAVSDYAARADKLVDDATNVCRKIAQGLDAAQTAQDAAEATADKQARMKAWCAVAKSAVETMKVSAGGTITIATKPAKCGFLVTAQSACQARCSGSTTCDVKANPPKCTGGRLISECKGQCTATAAATVYCEGTCSAECRGSCNAPSGVECSGKCTGTCTAGTAGTGVQADGSCKGNCKGKCENTAPNTTCNGACAGDCTATCNGTTQAPVKCDGKCDGDFNPLSCESGKLEGGCQVDARCDGACDVLVVAKAECPPQSVSVLINGAQNSEAAGKLRTTLGANLGQLAALQEHGEAMANISSSLTALVNQLTDIKAACIPPIVKATADGANNSAATVQALASVTSAAGTF